MDQLTGDYENASEIDMSKPDIKEVIDDLAEKEALNRECKELQQYRIVGEKLKKIYGTDTWNSLANMNIPEMGTDIRRVHLIRRWKSCPARRTCRALKKNFSHRQSSSVCQKNKE